MNKSSDLRVYMPMNHQTSDSFFFSIFSNSVQEYSYRKMYNACRKTVINGENITSKRSH